jgi:hypothetical protein
MMPACPGPTSTLRCWAHAAPAALQKWSRWRSGRSTGARGVVDEETACCLFVVCVCQVLVFAMARVETEPVGLGKLVSRSQTMTSHIAQYRQTPAARASRALSLLMSACSSPSCPVPCFFLKNRNTCSKQGQREATNMLCVLERRGGGVGMNEGRARFFIRLLALAARLSAHFEPLPAERWRLGSGGTCAQYPATGEECAWSMVGSSLGLYGIEPVGVAVGQRWSRMPQVA